MLRLMGEEECMTPLVFSQEHRVLDRHLVEKATGSAPGVAQEGNSDIWVYRKRPGV
jgi:hypothetical protein